MKDYIILCSVTDCNEPSRSLGMCKSHYAMFSRYGRYHKVKSGVKIFHPLYTMWNKRKQKPNNFVKEWLDFDTFIKAVGEKPEDCFLARFDETKPCGPDNFEWRKIKLKMLEGETASQYSSRYSKLARSLDPNHGRKQNYKYNFGLTLEEVEEKLKSQNYLCAICNEPETNKYNRTGKVQTLSIDHCHKTDKIRDMLCNRCNHILGRIKEDTNILKNMIVYLEKHNQ